MVGAIYGILDNVEAPAMSISGSPWSRREHTFLGGLIFPAGLCILNVSRQPWEELKGGLTEEVGLKRNAQPPCDGVESLSEKVREVGSLGCWCTMERGAKDKVPETIALTKEGSGKQVRPARRRSNN